MVKPLALLAAFGLLMAPGCGQKPPSSNVLGTASHGGVNFRFLDKTGSVEIGIGPADAGASGVSKQASRQVFAYFYQADGATPLAATPTDVQVVRGSLAPIPLLPGKDGRYASAPSPPIEELRGVLEANVGGRKVEVPFSIR